MIYNFFIINPGGLTMKKYMVTLGRDERESLSNLASMGKHRSQKILNALILLDCDTGEFQTNKSTNEEISRVLNISMKKIDRVKKRFVEEGMDVALDKRKADRVYTKKADGDFEAHLIALSCSNPPEGFARWSLRLLADKAVELNYIDSISHEAIRRILKKTSSNRGNTKGG
jgi:hypothetical protein